MPWDLETNGSAGIYGCKFGIIKSELKKELSPALQTLVGNLKSQPGMEFNVEHPNEPTGSLTHNKTLFRRRLVARLLHSQINARSAPLTSLLRASTF